MSTMEDLVASLASWDARPVFEAGKLCIDYPEGTPPPADLVEQARANLVELVARVIPGTWQPVAELPDLRQVGMLALDTETRDVGFATGLGTSWPWRDGHICGISVAYRQQNGAICAHYLPIRHPYSNNFDREQVFRWLKDHINSGVRFVTQNGLYDFGWLRAEADIRMPPSERFEEIGALATIVDENLRSYSLNNLCAGRGIPGKDEDSLKSAVGSLGLKNLKRAVRLQSLIWQLPAHCVGPYAEADAIATLALFESLYPTLFKEGTEAAYRLEVDILPVVHEMQRRGIRIDQSAAERARDEIAAKRDNVLKELSEKLGSQVGMVEIKKPKWLEQTFDAHGIEYPRTETGRGSFKGGSNGWMVDHNHFLPQLITRANKYHKAASTFLEDHILGHLINGRIHAGINPHRGEWGEGATTTRFSYNDPPLQQIPKRDEELGPEIRRCFLPEQGERWVTLDASQQEFRLLVHFAEKLRLPGASAAGDEYRNNPQADFHKFTSEIAHVSRNDAKPVNFGRIYGAGAKRLAEQMKKSVGETYAFLQKYDRALPFIKGLTEVCGRLAEERGYLILYDGARRHWPFSTGEGDECLLEEARKRQSDPQHPWFQKKIAPVKIYRALNSLIQGSAARHTKLWMRACWREGIVPLLQMHDALECSLASRKQAEIIRKFGQTAVKLTVPMLIDVHFGPNWGDAKQENL